MTVHVKLRHPILHSHHVLQIVLKLFQLIFLKLLFLLRNSLISPQPRHRSRILQHIVLSLMQLILGTQIEILYHKDIFLVGAQFVVVPLISLYLKQSDDVDETNKCFDFVGVKWKCSEAPAFIIPLHHKAIAHVRIEKVTLLFLIIAQRVLIHRMLVNNYGDQNCEIHNQDALVPAEPLLHGHRRSQQQEVRRDHEEGRHEGPLYLRANYNDNVYHDLKCILPHTFDYLHRPNRLHRQQQLLLNLPRLRLPLNPITLIRKHLLRKMLDV